MKLIFGCFLILVNQSLAARNLPSYIKTCHKDNPDFLECAKKSAKDAIPHILKGDRKWKIPSLTPLNLPHLQVTQSESLKISINDCIIKGLENMEVKDLHFDFDKKHIEVTVFSKWINLDTKYEIDGRILLLPIQGKGPANITFTDATFKYIMDYDLVDKEGEQYIDNIKSKVTYELGPSHYRLENLFNGNEQLSEQTNNFLNENQRDVGKELGATIAETINAIVTNVLKNFVVKVPFKNIFLKD